MLTSGESALLLPGEMKTILITSFNVETRQLTGTTSNQLEAVSHHELKSAGGWRVRRNNNACNAGEPGSIPRLIPWRRKRQPTPVFLPGESHGQRSLVGYTPWGLKESVTTEQLTQQQTTFSDSMVLSGAWARESQIKKNQLTHQRS